MIMINILLLPSIILYVFTARLKRATILIIVYQALIIKLQQIKDDSIENELKKLKTLNLSYFIGKSHFEEDGTNLFSISATKQIF